MDSLTQIALGAAVGEAALGRRVGNLAPAWGAALGTLPDLDVLLYPLLDPVNQLAVHRSFSHSILFSVVAAPVIGYSLSKLYRQRPATVPGWSWLTFLALFTHLALDSFTVYGTQVLWPFSNYPVSFNSVFIIDPLYTIPLAVGVILSLWRRNDRSRRIWSNRLGLLLSSLYLAGTLVAKWSADRSFDASVRARGVNPEAVMTTPAMPGSLLWMGIAREADTLYVGLTGLLDTTPDTRLVPIAIDTHLLDGHRSDPAVRRLAWFSKGWWAIERQPDGSVYVNDLRFGRSDAFLGIEADYIFRFRLVEGGSQHPGYVTFEQIPPSLRISRGTLGPVWNRALSGPAAGQ